MNFNVEYFDLILDTDRISQISSHDPPRLLPVLTTQDGQNQQLAWFAFGRLTQEFDADERQKVKFDCGRD